MERGSPGAAAGTALGCAPTGMGAGTGILLQGFLRDEGAEGMAGRGGRIQAGGSGPLAKINS